MNTVLTVQDCESIAKSHLKNDHVETVDFTVHSQANGNDLIRIKVNHNNKEKVLSFHLKKTPQTTLQTLFDIFKKTIPDFDDTITPNIYYGKSNYFFVEDLTSKGYKSCKEQLSLQHIQVTLQALAKLHAGSFVYEDILTKTSGKTYRLNKDYNLHPILINNKVKILVTSIFTENKEQLNNLYGNLDKNQKSSLYQNTFCCGNLISKNLLFKSKNDNLVDCKLINLESKLYAPPAYDILQLIFYNTNQEFRQHHYEKLLHFYHNALKIELLKYSVNIDDIQSFEQLEASSNSLLPVIKLEIVYHYHLLNEKQHFSRAVDELKEILASPRVTREDCYTIAKNKLNTSNYEFVSYHLVQLDERNGFMGDYYRLQIRVNFENAEKILNCFVKCMPKGDIAISLITESGCFFKEIFVYKTLVPQMQELGIFIINDCIPPCYLQRDEDFLIFEDLSKQNYKTLSSREPFDAELLGMLAKTLAKWHASSLIFEEKQSEKLGRKYRINEEYKDVTDEVFFIENSTSCAKFFECGLRSITDVSDLFPDLKEYCEKLHKTQPKLNKLFYEVIKTSKKYRNVFAHGDLWTNNVLVKFDKERRVDCLLVDFQLTRYCPPAHDFLCIFYLTTNRTIRLKYEKDITRIYYDELSRILAAYNYHVNLILPFDEFIDSIEYIRPQITMQAVLYGTFGLCTSTEIAAIIKDEETHRKVFYENRKEFLESMCAKSEIYKEMMKQRMMDLYDLCDTIN